MAKHIFSAEISHESAPKGIRERLAVKDWKVKAHLAGLSSMVDEVFILTTSNRFTVYAVSESIDPLIKFFSRDKEIFPHVHFYHNTEESVHHLFATASGLCSQIKGEHQIIEQINKAYQLALETDSVGLILDNLIREAIAVGKRVRTETGIDKFTTSVVDASFSLLTHRFQHLYLKTFLVVGTGKVARLTLEWLHRHHIHRVLLAGDNAGRTAELAKKYRVKAIRMNEVIPAFSHADVIIGGAHHEIDLEGSKPWERYAEIDFSKKRMIFDFGMPRNFNGDLREQPNTEFYNLDDLKSLHSSPLDAFGGLGEAWEKIMNETQNFIDFLRQFSGSPIVPLHLKQGWLYPKPSDLKEQDKELRKMYALNLIRNITCEPMKTSLEKANAQRNEAIRAVKRLYSLYNLNLEISNN